MRATAAAGGRFSPAELIRRVPANWMLLVERADRAGGPGRGRRARRARTFHLTHLPCLPLPWEYNVDEIRVERDALDDKLKQLTREGMAISSIVPEDRDDPDSDYLVRVERRTEIRGGL